MVPGPGAHWKLAARKAQAGLAALQSRLYAPGPEGTIPPLKVSRDIESALNRECAAALPVWRHCGSAGGPGGRACGPVRLLPLAVPVGPGREERRRPQCSLCKKGSRAAASVAPPVLGYCTHCSSGGGGRAGAGALAELALQVPPGDSTREIHLKLALPSTNYEKSLFKNSRQGQADGHPCSGWQRVPRLLYSTM